MYLFVILRDLSGFQTILVVVFVIGGLIVLSTFTKWLGRKVSAGLIKKGEKKQAARAEKIKQRRDERLEHILDNQEMLKKN